jgi:hypothetical protein
MVYIADVPNAGDVISQSQSILLENFRELNLVYGDTAPVADPNSDHYAYSDTSGNARKHRKVRLVRQAAGAGIPTPAATDGVMYSRVSATQTIPFYRKDAGTVDFPLLPVRGMIRYNAGTGAVVGTAFNLTVTAGAGTAVQILDFTEVMPDANYIVLAMTSTGSGSSVVNIIDATQFQITASNAAGERHVVVFHYAA